MKSASIIFGIIIYILLGIIMLYVYKKNKFNKGASYNGIVFSMLLYYFVIPIILLIFADSFVIYENKCGMWCGDSINKYILNKKIWEFLYSALCIGVSFVLFCLTYKKIKQGYKIEKNNENSIKLFKIFNYGTLIIGSICLIVFIISIGGITEMLKKAEYYRSFSNSLADDIGIAAILIIPARLITVTPFLSLYLINNDSENKKKYIISLVFSMILSAFFYLYNAGRAPIILFGLSIFYIILRKYFKHPWTIIICLAIVGLPLLDVADSLFSSVMTGSKFKVSFNYVKYIYQFIYPFRNVLNMHNINSEFGYRFGIDYVTSFLDLLPKLSFPASYENTSLFINGANWKVLGGIPNDFVTFANLQLGIFGNCLFSIILGYISAIVDLKTSNLNEGYGKNLLSAVMTLYSFSLIISFDFCTFIRGNFILIIISLLIFTSSKKEKIKS